MFRRIHVTLNLLVALFAMSISVNGADAEKITYYVQLVRGTVEDKSPSPDGKLIGSKVAKTFRPVFKWSHYWEMKRQEITVERGKKSRIQLNPQRAVEIDLTEPSHRKVTVFEGKNPVSTITDPSGGGAMSIIGGDRATNSSWFIVVRRDKPAN